MQCARAGRGGDGWRGVEQPELAQHLVVSLDILEAPLFVFAQLVDHRARVADCTLRAVILRDQCVAHVCGRLPRARSRIVSLPLNEVLHAAFACPARIEHRLHLVHVVLLRDRRC